MAPPPHTIEALQITLQQLEQKKDTYSPDAFGDLKRIILNRIAELELVDAMAAQPTVAAAETVAPTVPPELSSAAAEAVIAPSTIREETTMPAPDAATDLGKLD